MANQIPFSGASQAAGGYLLPDEQGEILTQGLLTQLGALQAAGDVRRTRSRKTNFPIWLGLPTAGPVGEGASKPVTGGEFGQSSINVKKFASIVLFTDEQIEDVQNGDLNVLVDGGVREAIAKSIDAHMLGKSAGVDIVGVFDSELTATTASVELAATPGDRLRLAVSAAMGVLEANGYGENMAVILGSGFAQHLRDARATTETTTAIYDDQDPLYGLPRFFSTNLNAAGAAPAAGVVKAVVVSRPNLHVRIRTDVRVAVSTEATVYDGTSDRKLFQEDLTAIRYETRLGFMVHDLNRAVVKITDAA
jgi:HK97 family phage major capsid protein